MIMNTFWQTESINNETVQYRKLQMSNFEASRHDTTGIQRWSLKIRRWSSKGYTKFIATRTVSTSTARARRSPRIDQLIVLSMMYIKTHALFSTMRVRCRGARQAEQVRPRPFYRYCYRQSNGFQSRQGACNGNGWVRDRSQAYTTS